jgi:hypothetical protein
MMKKSRKINESWDDLKIIMIKRFKPGFKHFKVQLRLSQVKDQDYFEAFLNNFQSLANQIPEVYVSNKQRLTEVAVLIINQSDFEFYELSGRIDTYHESWHVSS